jgi:CBS domain-containing protein
VCNSSVARNARVNGPGARHLNDIRPAGGEDRRKPDTKGSETMAEERTISQLMQTPDNVVAADGSVRATLPQFKLETARSLIAVAGHRPIGALTRNRVDGLAELDLDRPVHEFVIDVPLLEEGMTLDSARMQAGATNFEVDRLPVIDADGLLVGVVDRGVLIHEADTFSTEQGALEVTRAGVDVATVEITKGMTVRGSDDEKLGEIDQVLVEQGRIAALIVKHGMLGRHHKRISSDHVVRASDDDVYLDFGKQEFKFLADMEKMEAELS